MTEKVYDYVVVGAGLAGISFTETLLQNNKSVFVFCEEDSGSSVVAAGLFNSVILKRFTLVKDAQNQIDLLKNFYPLIEKRIDKNIYFELPTLRKLSSIEEQNNFITVSDRPLFQSFLSSEIVFKKYKSVESPFGFGQMKQTGYVDCELLITSYRKYLEDSSMLQKETFDYSSLKEEEDFLMYKDLKAKKIVFCEGFGMGNNPYFSNLPLDGVKGELLLIRAKNLDLDIILKANLFILPIGNDLYRVGATYNWEDKTNIPTEKAKKELLSELKEIITCDFEVIEHLAGIRPTVKDRKPLVGRHHSYDNIYLLNGLGTRGVMLAPYLSKKLFDFIEFDIPLDSDINIDRVYIKRK